jgi:FkbM family methyltransferase
MSRSTQIAARVASRLLKGRELDVRVLSGPMRGIRLHVDADAEKAAWAGIYERDVQRALVELARPGTLAFDVGSFHGYFAFLLARLAGRSVAFEPLPRNAARIVRSAALNDLDVTVVEAAAAEQEGDAWLEPGPFDAMSRLSPESTGNAVRVRTTTLDSAAERFGAPAIVKIDVEGAAGSVLAGARDVVAAGATFLCEIHGRTEDEAVRRALDGYTFRPLGTSWLIATR